MNTGAENKLSINKFLELHAKYAILSHTWIRDTPGDVIYEDWETRKLNRRGFNKIEKFCQVAALKHNITLCWMDTVCINKSSSSELDESIRSMYKWYGAAHVCLVYLSEIENIDNMHTDSWFTRGWTLQELLASKDLEFYNMHWEEICPSRSNDNVQRVKSSPSYWRLDVDPDVMDEISKATSITKEELHFPVEFIPISRKLQLAAQRDVTREEDTAYSLVGILGVDISVAYGEGSESALFRLLRALIGRKQDILDVFNYTPQGIIDKPLLPSNLRQYASRSAEFDQPGQLSLLDQWLPIEPIVITHLGIHVPLLLIPGLLRNNDEFQSKPYGDFWGVVDLKWLNYDLLESSIYTDDMLRKQEITHSNFSPLIATFGVLNFGEDGDDILIPQYCFSISLNCGNIKLGHVDKSKSKKIRFLPVDAPAVFQLKSKNNLDRVRKDELREHGMQLVTLYL